MASPFRPAAPSIAAAAAFAVAAATWAVAGAWLPGGRWLAVHLFTLGVLTNLVLTFSEHFARTVTRTPGERATWWPVVTNLAIVTTLVGVATGGRPATVAGALTLSGVVAAAYRRLRTMRRRAVGARFVWVVRGYERAHGAFLHGALLGALLGTGVVNGPWWGGVRLAHLHVNVLGWGGLTLLATLVFFGPSMIRTRIEPGADARAAGALRLGAISLSVSVLALLATGAPGGFGTAARVVAGLGLASLAVATAAVCGPVLRAVGRAPRSAARPAVLAVAAWLPLLVAADAAVVASGAWRWLDPLGLLALVAVLGGAIVATLSFLAPMLVATGPADRALVRARLDRGAGTRVVTFHLGVVLWAADAAGIAGGTGTWGARVGAGLVLGSVLTTVVAVLRRTSTALDPAPRLPVSPR